MGAAKPKKVVKKPFGLQFFWISHIGKREVHKTLWYPTKVSRDYARQKAQKQGHGLMKFTRIEEIER